MWRQRFAEPTDKMRPALLLLVAVAAVGASALRSDDSGSAESWHGKPCPDQCTEEYKPVCAKDRRGNLYQFSNKCTMEMCSCKMWMQQVPLNRCPSDAPGCPMRGLQSSGSSSDESSDESQSARTHSSFARTHHRNNELRWKQE